MKQCPECQAEYNDGINFCAKDGRSLVAKTVVRSRLCPHCANSIAEDATHCSYCKKELTAGRPAPQWLSRDSTFDEPRPAGQRRKQIMAKAVLVAGMILFVLGAFMIGSSFLGLGGQSQTRDLLEEKIKELQVKEQQIQSLENELTKVREQLKDSANQRAALKDTLDESRKERPPAQRQAGAVTRESDRSSASRAQTDTGTSSRPIEPVSPAPTRRAVEPGLYETTRATSVHEEPSASSRVVSQINKGTRINVVRSVGDWLEVRSKHGNPPGFIRWDDAMFVSRTN